MQPFTRSCGVEYEQRFRGHQAGGLTLLPNSTRILIPTVRTSGCTVTQSDDNLRNGLALAAHMKVSTFSSVFAAKLLKSPDLPSRVALNSTRLAESYMTLTNFLKSHEIEYFPSNVGVFVLMRLAGMAQS